MHNFASRWLSIFIICAGLVPAGCGGDDTSPMGQCSTDSECDDSNQCNGLESCVLGSCGAGSSLSDGTACMMAAFSGICRDAMCVVSECGDGFVDVANTEECDDANMTPGDGCESNCQFSCELDTDCGNMDACDGTETCDLTTHTCQMGTAVDCSMMTDMCNTGTCAPADGTCSAVPMDDGTRCDDGMGCTDIDACNAGSCAGSPVDCSALVDACNAGECDPDTGMCSAIAMADGTPCEDDDAATSGTVCLMGTCRAQGHAVLMGHDFFSRAASADHIIGNAVRLTSHRPGHVVLIGHDYYASNDESELLIGNAVRLANTAGDIRIVDYRQYADTTPDGEANKTRNAINAALMSAGRTATYTDLLDHTLLDLSDADVLLVTEQERGSLDQMVTVRDAWTEPLDLFVANGGVVIVCYGGRATSTLVARPGLFTIPSLQFVPTGMAVLNVAPYSPITEGIEGGYPATSATFAVPRLTGGTPIVRDSRGYSVVQHFSPPVQITEFTQYADPSEGSEQVNTRAAIVETTARFGWNISFNQLTDHTSLDLSSTHIFLIHEQENGAADTLTAVGTAWRAALDAFLNAGGILIMIDNRNTTARIANAAGLFTVTSTSWVTSQRMTVVDVMHPLVAGIGSGRYTAPDGTVSFSGVTEGTNVVTAPSSSPVIVHLTR